MNTEFKYNLVLRVSCIFLLYFLIRSLSKQSVYQAASSMQLTGQWHCTYLELLPQPINQAQHDGTEITSDIDFKTLKTIFCTDGSLYSEYKGIHNGQMSKFYGTWFIKADSIIIKQVKPELKILNFKLKTTASAIMITGILGVYRSGKPNQEFLVTLKKLP